MHRQHAPIMRGRYFAVQPAGDRDEALGGWHKRTPHPAEWPEPWWPTAEPWEASAACAAIPIDDLDFFARNGWERARASLVCERCPVRDECGDFAKRHRINEGVWGGRPPRRPLPQTRRQLPPLWLRRAVASEGRSFA